MTQKLGLVGIRKEREVCRVGQGFRIERRPFVEKVGSASNEACRSAVEQPNLQVEREEMWFHKRLLKKFRG